MKIIINGFQSLNFTILIILMLIHDYDLRQEKLSDMKKFPHTNPKSYN